MVDHDNNEELGESAQTGQHSHHPQRRATDREEQPQERNGGVYLPVKPMTAVIVLVASLLGLLGTAYKGAAIAMMPEVDARITTQVDLHEKRVMETAISWRTEHLRYHSAQSDDLKNQVTSINENIQQLQKSVDTLTEIMLRQQSANR